MPLISVETFVKKIYRGNLTLMKLFLISGG